RGGAGVGAARVRRGAAGAGMQRPRMLDGRGAGGPFPFRGALPGLERRRARTPGPLPGDDLSLPFPAPAATAALPLFLRGLVQNAFLFQNETNDVAPAYDADEPALGGDGDAPDAVGGEGVADGGDVLFLIETDDGPAHEVVHAFAFGLTAAEEGEHILLGEDADELQVFAYDGQAADAVFDEDLDGVVYWRVGLD